MYKRFEQVAAEAEDRDYFEAKIEALEKTGSKIHAQDIVAHAIAGIAQSYVQIYDEGNPAGIYRVYRDQFERQLEKYRQLESEIQGGLNERR